ncbi:MAG: 1-(5-phosphoribosyl)-5-[(5-phosphoribosylamino)methylideneamino] imidazole-4-carboxamide isomerase [Acidobacteria bacterium]|nr:1-(5-phosphoribosyl)-5-[(5-phosphoribosylamino)methylideneamino] imidazole-4-carboxamide isomerase [Acidobacteriota bacterium]
MQLIPSMDLMDGRVVRLRKGDPARSTFYDLEPEAWIQRLVEAGATRIHLVDLDGAFGRPRQNRFRSFPGRWAGVRFQLGGGLRSKELVDSVLAEGFDAVVGTLAVESPSALRDLPGDRILAALDLKSGQVATRGWTEAAARTHDKIFRELRDLGLDRALVTDVDRDGGLEGPGLESLHLVARAGFSVQASGGLRDLEDLAACATVPGVTGAISGKALLDGRISLDDPRTRAALGGS